MILKIFKAIKQSMFRLGAIAITIIYLSILLLIQHNRFIADDKAPILHNVDEKTQKLASKVFIGMHINSFPTFSFDSGEFTIDATVWFKFPAATEALSTIEQFTIYNSLLQENGILVYRSAPIIKLVGNDVIACFHTQTTFKLPLNQKYFPIGDHTLHILIQNKNATAQELVFISSPDGFTMADDLFTKNWIAKSKTVKTGFIQSDIYPKENLTISYPVALFSIDFENVGGKKIGALYIPMLIIFLIGLLTLLLGIEDTSRLGMITGALPSLVLFRIVIDGVSPNVGYSMHVDNFFYTFVFLLLIILSFQLYVTLTLDQIKNLTQEAQQKTKAMHENISDVIFILNLVFLMLLVTYSFYR